MIDFKSVSNLKVLVVGDAIIDEYCYVLPVGKSIKEPVISTILQRTESFRGGVWAAANHIRGFCDTVDVMCGEQGMTNRRFIDEPSMRKLFTVHERIGTTTQADCQIASYDLVVVTDFGHGALNKELIARLSREAQFLAVNAQTNSTNFGFNLITKYKRADFVVIDELEARLAAHDKDSLIEDVILALGFERIIVTLGYNGAIGFDGAFHRAPALTKSTVDTMGAGDAFLSICAPFAKAGYPMSELVKIGNAAGAAKVGIVGHRESVSIKQMEHFIGSRD